MQAYGFIVGAYAGGMNMPIEPMDPSVLISLIKSNTKIREDAKELATAIHTYCDNWDFYRAKFGEQPNDADTLKILYSAISRIQIRLPHSGNIG